MNRLRHTGQTQQSPLQQAKARERIATYSIALVVGLVMVLITRTTMVAITESPGAQARLMNAIIPIAQLIVSFSTLALVRHHMSAAVKDLEQSEQTASRLLYLTDAVKALKDEVRSYRARCARPADDDS